MIVKSVVAGWPPLSVVLHSTGVSPSWKSDPEVGEHVTGSGSLVVGSVAVTLNVAVAPEESTAGTVWLPLPDQLTLPVSAPEPAVAMSATSTASAAISFLTAAPSR